MRKLLCLAVLVPLFLTRPAGADIVEERKREADVPIIGLMTRAYSDTFKKHEPARACVSGKYLSTLGLYVFDPQGNCVAKDDFSEPETADDCFAVWIPAEQQAYSIEVRNAGIERNMYQFAIR